MMTSFKHIFLLFIASLTFVTSHAQFVAEGKITYERRTNLLKKFPDERMKMMLGGAKDKTDIFELFFNDTCSLFMPEASDVADRLSWATTKNVVYQKPQKEYRMTEYSFMTDQIFIEDSLFKRQWKLTGTTRNINGYECQKAIWQKNDSVRIYAWYSDLFLPSVGPESFTGLPGAILGLATEDGGVVYFAKKIEEIQPDFTGKIPEIKKNKLTTEKELRQKFQDSSSGMPDFVKGLIDDLFTW